MKLLLSTHALKRMFERSITTDDVRAVLESGQIIASYPEDRPLPSFLWFKSVRGFALHVVAATSSADETVVITVYRPDPDLSGLERKTSAFRLGMQSVDGKAVLIVS